MELLLGTSAFTADGWLGTFYPAGMQPRDYLSYYATKFNTVEVDSTYYRTPAKSTVQGWYDKTPPGFTFALKVPSLITHEKMLLDAGQDMLYFLETVALLRDKLGPLLLQFPYFNKSKFKSGQEFLSLPSKSVTVLGMSGVGKTTLAAMLQRENWFQYSVDYRIGTKYMDEFIADNFKREAMRVPFLADLLRSDSIYIRSNITFENLSPLSTYLGKPGSEEKGGITFAEYKKRQGQHRVAEIQSLMDVSAFIERARDVYGYPHFICDSGGSLCEVVNPDDPQDPVLRSLADNSLLLYIEGTPEHAKMLIERFRKNPKPMYYQPAFLDQKWDEYKLMNGLKSDADVDPNGFAVWGFEQLIHHRIPLYRKIADNFGYVIPMADVPKVKNEADFANLIARTIDASLKKSG